MQTLDEVLAHHGIKGMRWGVRRRTGSDGTVSSGPDHKSSDDAAKAKEFHTRAKSSGLHTLSNQELQHLTQRMNLEQQYSKLSPSSRRSKGAKFAQELLVSTGKYHAQQAAQRAAAKAIGKALKKKATGG